MTFNEAVATQPQWVQIWLNILFFAAFVLPAALLIWKASRKAGIITLGASILAGAGVMLVFNALGYVRLLGFPHIVLWTPLIIWLWPQRNRPDMPAWPRRIILVICTAIAVSLVFDVIDTARYLLGDRAPF